MDIKKFNLDKPTYICNCDDILYELPENKEDLLEFIEKQIKKDSTFFCTLNIVATTHYKKELKDKFKKMNITIKDIKNNEQIFAFLFNSGFKKKDFEDLFGELKKEDLFELFKIIIKSKIFTSSNIEIFILFFDLKENLADLSDILLENTEKYNSIQYFFGKFSSKLDADIHLKFLNYFVEKNELQNIIEIAKLDKVNGTLEKEKVYKILRQYLLSINQRLLRFSYNDEINERVLKTNKKRTNNLYKIKNTKDEDLISFIEKNKLLMKDKNINYILNLAKIDKNKVTEVGFK